MMIGKLFFYITATSKRCDVQQDDFLQHVEDDCDELPPPPGHCEEGMNPNSPTNPGNHSRILVSPRPIKNPVHDLQVSNVKEEFLKRLF